MYFYRKFILFCLVGFLLGNSGVLQARKQGHRIYTILLRKHVRKGAVRYGNLKKDPLFKRYIRQLEKTNPEGIKNKQARLAFWINAYNAYTLKVIIENYPIKSIKKLHSKYSSGFSSILGGTVWNSWKFLINKKEYTLDKIEHGIIRKEFNDPRIHAALVCAAKSCPPLRSEAYEASKLERQLASQMRQWLGNTKLNKYDASKNTLFLSKILKWYKEDFGDSRSELLEYLRPYFPSKVRKELSKNEKSNDKDVSIRYLDYDWSLNKL